MPATISLELLLQIIALAGAFLGGAISLFIFAKNSRQRRTEWIYTLYEKFFFEQRFSEMRRIIDYADPVEFNKLRESVTTKIDHDPEEKLVDFLNFFHLVANLHAMGQLEMAEVKSMFGYYLKRIGEHQFLIEYLNANGYIALSKLIAELRRI